MNFNNSNNGNNGKSKKARIQITRSNNLTINNNTNTDNSRTITNNYNSTSNPQHTQTIPYVPRIVATAPRARAPLFSTSNTNTSNSTYLEPYSATVTLPTISNVNPTISQSNTRAIRSVTNVFSPVTHIAPDPPGHRHNNTSTTTNEPLGRIMVTALPMSQQLTDQQLFVFSSKTRNVHHLLALDTGNIHHWRGAIFPVSENALCFGVDPTTNTSFVISDKKKKRKNNNGAKI